MTHGEHFEKNFIQSVVEQIPTQELEAIEADAAASENRMAHDIVSAELARRALVGHPLLFEDEYFVPTDPMDDLQCDSCQ